MDYRSSDVTKIEILEMGDVNNKNQSVKNSINKEAIHDSIIRKSIKEQAKKAKKNERGGVFHACRPAKYARFDHFYRICALCTKKIFNAGEYRLTCFRK